VAVALVAAAIGLAGCTPGPAPKPTPTPLFTSEAEAFKAAEQVYRDYVDATNANNDGIKERDPLNYLAGTALEDAVDGVRKRTAAGTSVKGHVALIDTRMSSATISAGAASVVGNVCVDVSGTRLENASGTNVTPTGRAPRALLAVTFSQSHERLLITRSELAGSSC